MSPKIARKFQNIKVYVYFNFAGGGDSDYLFPYLLKHESNSNGVREGLPFGYRSQYMKVRLMIDVETDVFICRRSPFLGAASLYC